ncbi:hypothetical protein J2S04_001286 [Alicyclobacillus tengchongensis]|uniref:ECF transporter S component n=1 Tax=Alicyclobacillus tolerans TaxID=90970 RepID=A0ABT9LVP3_9BACL|nr:hypothetical protein [Alicyclobacillus tengchongensis]
MKLPSNLSKQSIIGMSVLVALAIATIAEFPWL